MDDADAWIERGKRRRDLADVVGVFGGLAVAITLGICGALAHWTAVGWLMGWE